MPTTRSAKATTQRSSTAAKKATASSKKASAKRTSATAKRAQPAKGTKKAVKGKVTSAKPVTKKPVRKAKSPFGKAEIAELRDRLVTERAELDAQLVTFEENTFAASQSDMSGEVAFDDETADAGTATFERERDLSIENNVRDLLRKIDRALKRMDAGVYGICDRCGKPIEKARMKALPYVDLCIKDAQAQSRR